MMRLIPKVMLWRLMLSMPYINIALAAEDTEIARVEEAVILNNVEGYMADVLSMTGQERSASVVTLEYEHECQIWQVTITANGTDLCDETKYQLSRDYCEKIEYDPASDTYFHYILYDANGNFVEGCTIEGYEFSRLVPHEAYPAMPEAYADYEYFDPLKCFLYAPAADKAEFSQTYKPIVDEWFAKHPQYKVWLSSQNHYMVMITHNNYGTPPPNMLQESKALQIACEYCASHDSTVTMDALMTRYHQMVYYDVTESGKPVWKIRLMTDVERMIAGDVYRDFYVVIDVWSGKVIRDQNMPNESDVEYHYGR